MRVSGTKRVQGAFLMAKRSVVVAVAAGILAAACGGGDGQGAEAGGGTLVVAQSFEPQPTLDPALTANVITYNVVRPVIETLVTIEPGGTEIVPLLATTWQVSPDGRSWSFRLRDDVRFHDGTPFDAAAVCANFERWYHFRGVLQSLAFGWSRFFGGFATRDDASLPARTLYQSCEVRSVHEIVLNLTEPAGALLAALALPAFGISSPTALRRYGADKVTGTATEPRFEGSYGSAHLVGTGPLTFDRWDRGDKVVLVRNRAYWRAGPELGRVIIRRIADGAARRQALESGEINGYWPVNAVDLEPLRRAGFRVYEAPSLTLGYLDFNLARPPLDNLKIRQAIAHALDKEKVVRAKYPPSASVAKEILPPDLWGHAPDVRVYPHDPDRARRLIAESGVADAAVELAYPKGGAEGTPPLPDPEGIALSFKADLEGAGFTVALKPLPFQDFFEALSLGTLHLFLNEIFSFQVDPDALFDQFIAPRQSGSLGPVDAGLVTVLDGAAREIDRSDRAPLYQQANRIVADQALVVPFVHVKAELVYSQKVSGYRPSPIFWEGLFDVRLD